jgi:hypothetical protein
VLKALEHLTHQLSELRSGARFNTDALERLHVKLKTGESLLVKDLAQVVIKGRFVNVILSDEEVYSSGMACLPRTMARWIYCLEICSRDYPLT